MSHNSNCMFNLFTKNLSAEVSLKNLPTLRQAFVAASLIIITAFVLARVVHPDWIYLALLPAFGLMFSGLVGVCPMIMIMQAMPWNKNLKQPKAELNSEESSGL